MYSQVRFIRDACRHAGIPFYILPSNLHHHYLERFGSERVVSIPFWSIQENGKEGVMPRYCTIEFKIERMQKFTRWIILRYKKGQPLYAIDRTGRHNIHIGFSYEERHRCKANGNEMFTNVFPLVDMKLTRAHNYAYCRDVWGLETRASACNFCPFHKNYFFWELRQNHKAQYEGILHFDNMLDAKSGDTRIHSKLYISRSRKRIIRLDELDYDDAEMFLYRGEKIWNGF